MKGKFSQLLLTAAALLLLYAACGGHGDGGGDDSSDIMHGKATCSLELNAGVFCAKIVAADGTTPLSGAEIKLTDPLSLASSDASAKGVEDPDKCITDTAGDAACVLPEGTSGIISLTITYSGYTDRIISTNIVEGLTTDLGTLKMTGSLSQKWAVVPGSFDGVQVLLAQLKGCTLNNSSGSPFDPTTENASEARTSDACENSGLLVLDDTNTAYSRYVTTFLKGSELANYGMLFINCDADYSSDPDINNALAMFSSNGGHIYFSDLSGAWLTRAFPSVITLGPHNTWAGTISANVADAGLAEYVGNPIDVVFNVQAWQDIDSMASNVTTYIEGNISNISTLQGSHPLTVGWRPTGYSGCVFYTSYHVEGPSTGSDQELAIKYLIQNFNTACRYIP
ncbi:MAG: hypothetical protein WC840_04125 [Candidatus Peribacteraceae bacterium]